MPTKITLIISFLLIVLVPWYVFWLAGAEKRANPKVFLSSADGAVAIELEENTLLRDIAGVTLGVERGENASIVEIQSSEPISHEGGRLIMKQALYSDTVALPLLIEGAEGELKVIQDVFYDVDYKTDTLWIVAALSSLDTAIYVIDGESLTFSYTNNEMRYAIDEEGISSWALGTNLASQDIGPAIVALDSEVAVVIGVLGTSSKMHIGFSEEVEPTFYELPGAEIVAGGAYAASSTFSCVKKGEFDWFLRPTLPISYGVTVLQGAKDTNAIVTARVSARIFSKCEKEED